MRLRLATLLLAAAAGPAFAQPPPAPEGEIYAAHGTEPFWSLTFEDGKMIWATRDGDRIEVARPRPVTRDGVHYYRAPRMTVEISHEGRCNDGMSELDYPDTVRVRFGRHQRDRALQGCGGGALPPVSLDETRWQIVDIDGIHVGGEQYKLGFQDDGQVRGRAGCNDFAAPYTQVGRTLTVSPLEVTSRSCAEDGELHEGRVLRLLRGPVQISYRGGLLMVLSGNHDGANIAVTLRRLGGGR